MPVTPMFPLESVRLPGEDLPLRIFEPRYGVLVQDCLAASEPAFGVVLISAGREVGGGDARLDVGALAHIDQCEAEGVGRYRLVCSITERIRILQWHNDDPYPQATVELWPDEVGPAVPEAAVVAVEDQIMAVFSRLASVRGMQLRKREFVLGPPAGDVGKRLYRLASRVPMGQADKYSVLAAPHASARLAALTEAVESVAAMVEFQLSQD
ncbi:MAG: LON peptidase substrate-binding domain-containing protein [Mycobacterium sp.]